MNTLPLGVYDDGSFAAPLHIASAPQEASGDLSLDLLRAKVKPRGRGVVGGELNADKLDRAGWAIMFGASVDPLIRQNLAPLMEHRKAQVGDERLYKILDPPLPGQTATAWLTAHGTSLAVVDPEKGVPFYILIVASPEEIPFEFQYELDLYWGVGRLWLETNEAYLRYAHSVIDYETKPVTSSRQMVIFAPSFEGQDNGAGKALTDYLVQPMIANGVGKYEKFKVQAFLGPAATKQQLHDIFNGSIEHGTPAVMFTGTHGLLKARASRELAATQGAIVCEPWKSPPTRDFYYAAWDLSEKTRVHGMVHFIFSCYGMGWPQYDTYNYQQQVEISPAPMMARLPQALLGRENGALAVLGHIDRAWASTYRVDGQSQDQSFRDVLVRIMSGYRLGSATDQFNVRWAALSVPLSETLRRMRTETGLEDLAAHQLKMRDDARNYILHGDPAVKLRADDMPRLV